MNKLSQVFQKSGAMKVGLVLVIIGIVLYIIGLNTPLNAGVPRSPGRIVLYYIWHLVDIGLIVMMWGYFSYHKKWLVPWYEEGMKIDIFSSNRVVRIALVAAGTIVLAFVKIPVLGWSIRTVMPVFGAMYFGLLEGVLGGWIGYMLSTLIVGGYEYPLITLPTWGIGDGVVVAYCAVFFFEWIRNQPSAKTRSWRYVVMLITGFIIWYVLIVAEAIGFQGAAVFLPYAFQYLIGGLMVLVVIFLIAVGAVEVLHRTSPGGFMVEKPTEPKK